MQGAVDGISAGAVSLTGVSQAAPQSAATNVDTSGADSISTSITSAAANSWVVDVVGSGNSGSFTPSSGQTERWDIAASGMTGATSTKALTAAGATTLGWSHSGANRLAHSLASLAPSGAGAGHVHPDHERERLGHRDPQPERRQLRRRARWSR